MKKVISYSLFGNKSIYYDGVDVLILAHHSIFKDFELRIYFDSTTRKMPQFASLERLAAANKINLIFFEEGRALTRSMSWRFLPLFDADVDYLFCRDIDSLPLIRDRAMVDEFIESGCTAHNIYDDYRHNWQNIPLMGGCMGFNVKKLMPLLNVKDFEELMRLSGHDDQWFDTYAHDEVFLREKIWPLVKNDAMLHLTKGQPDCPDAKINLKRWNIDYITNANLNIELLNSKEFAFNVCAKGWDIFGSREFYYKNGPQDVVNLLKA